jgi:FAD/FMN-containing dehydrogenase
MVKWRAVSPGAGAYFSEADITKPNFQQAFYGSYYLQLYGLKQKFDPYGLFNAPTAVGSEDW